jgi:hypothetical protein
MASLRLADLTLHVDEILEKETRARLEKDLRSLEGVTSVRSSSKTPHLIVVTYDPHHAKAKDILKVALGEHLHAQLIGL